MTTMRATLRLLSVQGEGLRFEAEFPKGLSRAAAEDSLRLSVEKYCSVHACLRPDLPITQRIELSEG